MNKQQTFLSDDNGTPLVLYHGTYYDFDYFRPLMHFGPRINAETNLREGKWKRDPNIDITKPKIIPINVMAGKYPEIPDLNDHSVKNWMGILFQYMCRDQIQVFMSAMENQNRVKFDIAYRAAMAKLLASDITVPAEFDFICAPALHKMSDVDIKRELSAETLFDIHNAENLFFQRMILYFESIGINGFKYKNFTEGTGDYSYIIFRQNSIHRQDKQLPQYPIPSASALKVASDIKSQFMVTHEPRLLSRSEKEQLLNEIYGFYTFRFNEMGRILATNSSNSLGFAAR